MAQSQEVGRWLELSFRVILAGFFILAGVLKILDPKALTAAIETYQLLPYTASLLLALLLPWMEVLAGLGVLFKRLYGGSLMILALLLLLFIIALTQGWIRGLDVSCGCFGSADHENQTNYAWLILRDLILLAIAGTLWIRQALSDRQV
jgi:putative oxidoreductase